MLDTHWTHFVLAHVYCGCDNLSLLGTDLISKNIISNQSISFRSITPSWSTSSSRHVEPYLASVLGLPFHHVRNSINKMCRHHAPLRDDLERTVAWSPLKKCVDYHTRYFPAPEDKVLDIGHPLAMAQRYNDGWYRCHILTHHPPAQEKQYAVELLRHILPEDKARMWTMINKAIFLRGSDFSLRCTVTYRTKRVAVTLQRMLNAPLTRTSRRQRSGIRLMAADFPTDCGAESTGADQSSGRQVSSMR